jgi:hypothetical protein
MDYDDDILGLENWEDDIILLEKKDWIGLLKLREKRAKKQPSDLYAQQRFVQALILNKKYKDALDVIIPIYKDNYESGFGVSEIMDALLGLGKTEDDFEWIKKPSILQLDQRTINKCLSILKEKRKYISVVEVYLDLMLQADYLTFDEKGLTDLLMQDSTYFDFKIDRNDLHEIKLKIRKIQ